MGEGREARGHELQELGVGAGPLRCGDCLPSDQPHDGRSSSSVGSAGAAEEADPLSSQASSQDMHDVILPHYAACELQEQLSPAEGVGGRLHGDSSESQLLSRVADNRRPVGCNRVKWRE